MNFWQSETIRLRALEPSDAEVFCRWNLDSQRAAYLDFLWPPTSRAATEKWLDEQSRGKLEGDQFHFMVESAEGVPVGTIATHLCVSRSGTFSYGIDIAAEHRRKGYARAAIRMVLRYYFDFLRYQKCTVLIHADNTASIALHEDLRFQLEGRLRSMVYQDGCYLDALFFGITHEEFQRRCQPENPSFTGKLEE